MTTSGKYNSYRDEILHALCLADWANESFGDVSTYGMYVCRIELTWEDVKPMNGEFNSLIDSLGLVADGIMRDSLVGNFIVWEDSQGFVYVLEGHSGTTGLFNGMRDEYDAWMVANDDSEPFDVHDLSSNEYHGDVDWGHERDYPHTD